MNHSETRAKQASSAIAQIRKHLTFFTLSELTKELKKFGCPYASTVTTCLKDKGLITQNGREYSFIEKEPIHFAILIPALDKTAASVKKYVADSRARSLGIEQTQKVWSDEELISILKSKGYRIMRPVTNYEEC